MRDHPFYKRLAWVRYACAAVASLCAATALVNIVATRSLTSIQAMAGLLVWAMTPYIGMWILLINAHQNWRDPARTIGAAAVALGGCLIAMLAHLATAKQGSAVDFSEPALAAVPCGIIMFGPVLYCITYFFAGLIWPAGAPPENRPMCLHCGYDLRGNTSGKCPECGTPIPLNNEPD